MTLLCLAALPSWALNQRSFVSSSGVDTNPCTRNAPCRNFAAALAQTLDGGEVVAIDSAGYGAIGVIDKSVSIVAPLGVHAGMSIFSGNGATISAPGGAVELRNLFLTSLGGAQGIEVSAADNVHLNGLTVTGFGNGVVYGSPAASSLMIADSLFRQNQTGIGVGGPGALATIVRCRVEGSLTSGVAAGSSSRVFVRDTVVVKTGNSGFITGISHLGDATTLDLENCTANGNLYGVAATSTTGATSTIRVSNCSITNNGTGVILNGAGAAILSRGNNTVEGNGTNGAFSGSFPAK